MFETGKPNRGFNGVGLFLGRIWIVLLAGLGKDQEGTQESKE